jgi:hypothetical protein
VPATILDATSTKVHNRVVGPSLNIPDARSRGATLRVTRNSGQHHVVFSHWRDGKCIASIPIAFGAVPGLINALVDALGSAAVRSNRPSIVPTQPPRVAAALQRWLHPRVAQVTELRSLRDMKHETRTG